MRDMGEVQYEPGHRLGHVMKDGRPAIYNHLKLTLSYHKYTADLYRVVGFRAEPMSVDRGSLEPHGESCSIKEGSGPQYVNTAGPTELYFSYSVHWEESDIRWASRWDVYLNMSDVQIHWFSIINSVVVVFFLSGIITMIIIRSSNFSRRICFQTQFRRIPQYLISLFFRFWLP